MNMYIAVVSLGCFFTAFAWEFADMLPVSLFPRHESTVSHEFIKVIEPIALTITQQLGTVKVKGWDKESISIEITQKGSSEALENTIVSINKDKLPRELLCTVTRKNEEKQAAHVTFLAYVPFNCDLTVQSQKGLIKTKNLSRAQSLFADDGNIEIVLSKFSVDSSIFVHNKKGSIMVEAPKKIQAQLAASTLRGTITSELFITLQPQTTLLGKDYWHRVKKEVNGFLGDGGAPVTLEAEYGDIKIRAKK
ncbi:MAG: hypothetical protein K2X90_01920 [Candidatus Babeliaceae bacterium]|nr:hypothetical protein [Candidatus Babeliaceae bacterium]